MSDKPIEHSITIRKDMMVVLDLHMLVDAINGKPNDMLQFIASKYERGEFNGESQTRQQGSSHASSHTVTTEVA